MMQAGDGQQRRNRRVLVRQCRGRTRIRMFAPSAMALSAAANSFSSAASKPFRAVGRLEQNRQRDGLETGPVDVPEFFQFLVGEDRMLAA